MPIDDQEMARRLAGLKESWRVAEDPPLDQMWQRIEAEAFPTTVRALPFRWVRTLLPLAAMLIVGFGVGQMAPPLLRRGAPVHEELAAGNSTSSAQLVQGAPFVGVATDYLERVTSLLVTLASESWGGKPVEYSATQARDLLTTTRLLMDAPQPIEPRLTALLEDLELVLAQIVRLPARPDGPDVYLIDQALDQRAVIPRLRVFLAEAPPSAP
jgi:hypothetical protein